MQGKSESWRRLDRLRTADTGPAGRPSLGASPSAVDAGVTAASGNASTPPRPVGATDAVTARRPGRHAARWEAEDEAPPSAGAGPDESAVRPWVPDDEVEGPVVGAALDRWIARQASAVPGPGVGPDDPGRRADGSDLFTDDEGPDEESGGTTGPRREPGPGGPAEPDAFRQTADPSESRRRPVSRWRARLHRSLGRSAELWVPEPLRGARVDPGRRGAMALLLVAALAAAITAVGVWRDRPEARPVATVSAGSVDLASVDPSAVAAGAAGAGSVPDGPDPVAPVSGMPSAVVPTEIVVSVTGLVVHPGVVTVAAEARVADAIAAAGGPTDGGDLTGLNLAAKLTDGASVVVGAAGSTSVPGDGAGSATVGGASSAGSGAGRVDLNTADAAELDTLPGVGPVMAGNIISWREANGRFASVDQLQEISGIGPARYAQLSELVTVS